MVSDLKHFKLIILPVCLFSFLSSQSATVQTAARAGGASTAQVPNGYYNITASQADGWTFTVSGFVSGGSYRVKANNDGGGTWNNVTGFVSNPGTAFSFTIDEATVNAASNVAVADGNRVFFQVQSFNGDNVSQGQVNAEVTGGYGGNHCFYIDRVSPEQLYVE